MSDEVKEDLAEEVGEDIIDEIAEAVEAIDEDRAEETIVYRSG